MERELKTTCLALGIVCLLAVFNGGSCCDTSWIRFGENCYKIFPMTIMRYVARFKCLVEGSDLASISNVSVLDFLAQHVAHTNASKFWVGLQVKNNGEYVWVDGNGDVKDQPWVKTHENQEVIPTGYRPFNFNGCFAYDGALVQSTECIERIGVICSHKFTKRKEENCHIYKESFIGETTGNCLFRSESMTTKNKVDELCQEKERAYFADVDDIFKDGLSSLHNHHVLPDDGSKYWTGLTWNGTNMFWSTGHHVFQEFPIPVVEGSGSCVTVRFNFTDSLQVEFLQTECDEEAYVVCSKPQEGLTTGGTSSPPSSTTDHHSVPQMDPPYLNCPEGYNWKADRQNNYCYWETSFETGMLSWNESEMYCKGFGGHLASFHSVEEEKIGLSFQYGSLAHSYWIGLNFDLETETYKWIDGSPVDYTNWAPGHPNHKDKQLQCVAMEAQAKHWVSSLCGILSWFICKVPAKEVHPSPVLPKPTPLESCSLEKSPVSAVVKFDASLGMQESVGPAYFQGACYFFVNEAVSWHRAKQHCENEGATLVSIHSTAEIGFLLRLLHESHAESGGVWIGLNSLDTDGTFRWADWSAVDFTFFGENEPDNYRNQEKCCHMNVKTGEWSDENCNAHLSFICMRRNDTTGTTTVPSTPDPSIGNCKKGWLSHNDRCYYLGGKRKKDRVNWTDALDICQMHGGYLTSIRNEKDQSFLSYLLQIVGGDAWIGLHDTIQSGRYYWLDNSEVRYTNWAPGEPSFFGISEDCVKLVYDHIDSGVWKDDECGREFAYICQNNKDPQLPPSPFERGVNCLHPEGWVKLENMCFKMFQGNPLTWEHAESVCQQEGGHLVSVSDQRVKAIVSYLASDINQPFFIGLKYDKDSQKVKWLNDHVVMVSNWEKNEPSFLTENTCFASTSEGYWMKASCQEKMPYACQTTTGKSKKPSEYSGECPSTSLQWTSGSNSFCYLLDDNGRYDWFTANLMCFRYGSHLTSLHSKSEIEDIKKLMAPHMRSVYIGLMRNRKGGFTWMDDSPVDFENWDVMEPSNTEDQCVEMLADTAKWKVIPCNGNKYFVCKDRKATLVHEDPQSAEFTDVQGGLSTVAITVLVLSIFVGIFLFVAAVFYRRRSCGGAIPFRRQLRSEQSVSFENALFKAGSVSMEFQDESSNT